MGTDSGDGAPPVRDDITQQRTRLTRRFAVVAFPLVLLGVVLMLFDIGPERLQSLPFLAGMLVNLAAWAVGAWRYPRPLGG